MLTTLKIISSILVFLLFAIAMFALVKIATSKKLKGKTPLVLISILTVGIICVMCYCDDIVYGVYNWFISLFQ